MSLEQILQRDSKFRQVKSQGQHGSGTSGYKDSMVQSGQVTETAWFSQVRIQGQHGSGRSGYRDSMVQAGQVTGTAWFRQVRSQGHNGSVTQYA